jgi:hypothetical protein
LLQTTKLKPMHPCSISIEGRCPEKTFFSERKNLSKYFFKIEERFEMGSFRTSHFTPSPVAKRNSLKEPKGTDLVKEIGERLNL